jgi:hypothetical protein
MARDYRAEYRRRIASARARGLSLSQARGHPRPGEPHAADVGRALAEGRRRPPRPRPARDYPPMPAARHYMESNADDSDLRELQAWRERPYARSIQSMAGPITLTLDTLIALGSLDLQLSSIDQIDIVAHGGGWHPPWHIPEWQATFWPRRGNPRFRDLPADPAVIGDLRLTFTGPDHDVDIFVDTDGTTVSREPASEPPLDDTEAEVRWESSYDEDERERLQGIVLAQEARIAELERALGLR